MPELFLTIAKIMASCSIVMIVVTAVTMLSVRKRRTRDEKPSSIEFIRAYEMEKAAREYAEYDARLVAKTYGKASSYYYGSGPTHDKIKP